MLREKTVEEYEMNIRNAKCVELLPFRSLRISQYQQPSYISFLTCLRYAPVCKCACYKTVGSWLYTDHARG